MLTQRPLRRTLLAAALIAASTLSYSAPALAAPTPARFTEADRAQAIEDLRRWRVDALVLGKLWRRGVLKRTVTAPTGIKPQRVGEAWVWDVRSLTTVARS